MNIEERENYSQSDQFSKNDGTRNEERELVTPIQNLGTSDEVQNSNQSLNKAVDPDHKGTLERENEMDEEDNDFDEDDSDEDDLDEDDLDEDDSDEDDLEDEDDFLENDLNDLNDDDGDVNNTNPTYPRQF